MKRLTMDEARRESSMPALPKGPWKECGTTCLVCRRYVRCAAPPDRPWPWTYTDEHWRPVAVCGRCVTAAAKALMKPSMLGMQAEPFELPSPSRKPSGRSPAAPRRSRSPRTSS